MNFMLKSRKVQRFFDRRFEKAEQALAAANLEAQVRADRQPIEWVDVPELSGVDAFYSFHDQNCPDVRSIPTKEWWCSHFRGSYRLHLEQDASLSYEVRREADGVRIVSPSVPRTWVYCVSRIALPAKYAIEFDYTPYSVFKEQLQLDFAATSLAERHRFILTYNERLRYQRIERGFLLPDVAVTPLTLPLGRPTRIRLEVAGQVFSLCADGRTVACWRDRRYCPRPARTFLLLWNGTDERTMDVRIGNFRVQFARA